jgi:hypothetical protein
MMIQDVLPYVSVVLAIAGFFIGRISASKEDGKRDGTLLTELVYIKASLDEVKNQLKEQGNQYVDVVTRLSSVEASVAQAHHRIDEIREGRG